MEKKLSYKKWKEYYKGDLDNITNLIKSYIISKNLDSVIDLDLGNEDFIHFLYNNSSKYKCKYL